MKKLLAITLSICMMICALSLSAFAASDPYDDIDAAVAAIGLKSLADKVDQESIYGSPGISANESFEMLLDDDVTTKFGTREYPAYVAWKMDKAYSIGGIIFATANDNASNPGRNPNNWVLKGSHDDSTWVDIAKGTYEDLEDENYTYYTVKFEKATDAYEYFMFEIDEGAFADFFQMSELVLCEADGAAPVATAPAVVETPAETEAPVVDIAPVETAAPVATTTAPATFDAVTVIVIASVIALAAFAVSKKAVR